MQFKFGMQNAVIYLPWKTGDLYLCSCQWTPWTPLLKDCQRFDAISTSNLEVYKFRDFWILTYFIFGHGESSLNNIWSMVNLRRTCVLLFYYFLCLKVNLDLEKTNQLGESSLNFIFAVVNLDPIILEKRWIDGESWPNNFVEKVNRGEDLRWVGSRCPLTCALVLRNCNDIKSQRSSSVTN